MIIEIQALEENKTQGLVPLPSENKTNGSRWAITLGLDLMVKLIISKINW